MKYGMALLLLAFTVLSSVNLLAAPRIQTWTSPQGTPVFFLPTEGLPLVDISLTFDAGSARDGSAPGLASLTGSLLDQGAGGASAGEIAERLEGVGAQFGVGVSRDSSSISLRSLTDPKALETALSVFSDVVARPDFQPADVDRLRQRTLVSIKAREESPGTLAQLAFFKQIFGDHPYARPIAGDADSVAGLTREQLQQFHQRYYVAHNAWLVIVGEVSRQQAEAIADQLLSGLASGSRAAPLPEVRAPKQAQFQHINYPSAQTHIYSGLPGIHRTHPDLFPLVVGNHILGGSGFTSRIVKEIREKRGLSYSAYSYFSPMVQTGPFTMGLQTRNEKAEEARQALSDTLRTFVTEGPSEEELAAAKKNITGGFALNLDSNRKLLGQIQKIAFYGLPLDYLDNYIDRVNAVTTEQIRDAFQRHIQLDKLATVQVGQRVAND